MHWPATTRSARGCRWTALERGCCTGLTSSSPAADLGLENAIIGVERCLHITFFLIYIVHLFENYNGHSDWIKLSLHISQSDASVVHTADEFESTGNMEMWNCFAHP